MSRTFCETLMKRTASSSNGKENYQTETRWTCPGSFGLNTSGKTKIYHLYLIHYEILLMYYRNQLRYQGRKLCEPTHFFHIARDIGYLAHSCWLVATGCASWTRDWVRWCIF